MRSSLNMGTKLTVDKHLSNLEDVLALPPTAYSKVLAEFADGADEAAQHLKVWRISEDHRNSEFVKTSPVTLSDPSAFNSRECYLLLLIYKPGPSNEFHGYPQPLGTFVESISNLTPRGLESVFASDTADPAQLDSYMLSQRPADAFHYMLFLWNGKQTSPLTKALALSKGFELDSALVKGKSAMLEVLHNGGVIRGKKLQKGPIVPLESAFQSDRSIENLPEQGVYLLRWLMPTSSEAKPKFTKFKQHFMSKPLTEAERQRLFVACDPVEPPRPKLEIKLEPKPKLASLSLAGLKTREDEMRELQLNPNVLANIDENFDIRDTNRKELKMQQFSDVASEVCEGLYVGSDVVAHDKKTLLNLGITHVINCAGNVCANYYPEDFEYLCFFLKDSDTESIEAVFYPCIQFIETAFSRGGKVYVHCMQGVSRSVTVCLSYLIFKYNRPYEDAFRDIRGRRSIASPNFGFQMQLMWWFNRLYNDYKSLPVSPRVFGVGSHQLEQPRRIVAKCIMQGLFRAPEALKLDPRGMFIVQTASELYLWQGSCIYPANIDKYLETALKHIQNLQTHEHASKQVIRVSEGNEPEEFWRSFNIPQAHDNCIGENRQWDNWYKNLETAEDQEPVSINDLEEDEVDTRKKKLYVFPELDGLVVYDEDEMMPENLVCLCTDDRMFVWRGSDFEGDADEVQDYLEDVQRDYWSAGKAAKVFEEELGEESEEFLRCF
mmetsp:Transcript_3090/g.6395  ORF Transcript_3090/g.6395 Transcript_3090/m.6395 type:complete len:720 (-) Transcript_3090:2211-4370(-)